MDINRRNVLKGLVALPVGAAVLKTLAASPASGQLFVSFDGAFLFIMQPDKVIALAPIMDQHIYKINHRLLDKTGKDRFHFRLAGNGLKGAQHPMISRLFSKMTFDAEVTSIPDKAFRCEMPIPKQISCRSFSPATVTFGGEVRDATMPQDCVFIYDAADVSIPRLEDQIAGKKFSPIIEGNQGFLFLAAGLPPEDTDDIHTKEAFNALNALVPNLNLALTALKDSESAPDPVPNDSGHGTDVNCKVGGVIVNPTH